MAAQVTETVPTVWDTVCTFGRYQHETINGEPCITVHDASTCKVMLDDFAAHPQNDIFYDKQHEVVDALGDRAVDDDALREWAGDGHAMAWGNALVMIVGGQVVRYEPHPGAPQEPPTADQVLRQSDGSMRPDGVYCLRASVTPRGADENSGIAAFRYTSPFFVPEKDGHRLLNLTVTNDPRMRDCALAFQRSSGRAVAMSRIKAVRSEAAQENKPMVDPKDAAVMTAAGIGPDDSPEQKLSKMTSYARQMEECVQASKMDAGEHAAIEMLKEKIAMLEAALASKQSEDGELRESMKRMEEERRMEEARKFARGALAMGRVFGKHKGSPEQTEAWLADAYRKDPKGAENLLAAEKTFQPSLTEAMVMGRLTAHGAGIGAPQPSVPKAVSPIHAAQNRYSVEHAKVMTRLRTQPGGDKMPVDRRYDAATKILEEEQPDLIAALRGE